MRKAYRNIVSVLLAGTLAASGTLALDASALRSYSYAEPAASTASSSAAASAEEQGSASDGAADSQQGASEQKESSSSDIDEKQVEKKSKEAAEKAKKAAEQDASETADGDSSKDGDGKKKGKSAKADPKEVAKQKQVARAAAYLQTLSTKLETATEDLQQIKVKRKKAEKKAKKAKSQLTDAKDVYLHARRSLNSTVKEIYENGDLSFFSVLLGANNFDDFASRLYLLESIASQREGTMSRTQALKADYEGKLAEYKQQLAEVKSLEQEAAERKQTISDSIDAQLKLVGQLDPAMLSLVNGSDSYKATRKWLAKYYGSKSKKGSHPEIVKIASEYLGVPYVWGGESPSGFDCSGLTMYCYAKIGISLPHYARSQYDCGKHIAREALMPGDLVFFGPNVEGIHHVGIYVGAGKYLQAPRTGDVVKVSSLADRSDYVGACRPGA